jgi:hopanoid biosynthesis associated radical SAM protein HpnH
MWTVASYVMKQKYLKRRERYPLVLMLEINLRCNLACAGCGKIQYPGEVLKQEMSVDAALAAANECGAPIVSIPGGEPLLHSNIEEIVEGLIAQGRYVYLCTNAVVLKKKLEEGRFKPNKKLTFSIHMDGDEQAHDFAVCKEGVYKVAEEAIEDAVKRGFRVTTNTTLFDHVDVPRMRAFFDRMMEVGVESMMLSPGYSYSKAPDQESFLNRQRTNDLFAGLLEKPKKGWKFNHSPLFLEYLLGKRHLECTPWGNPCYTLFGWQRPCYLLQEGYTETFQQLLDETEWSNYGRASGNAKCQQCMVHCGHEPTAVDHTFGSASGFFGTVRAVFKGFNRKNAKHAAVPQVTGRVSTGKEAEAPGTLQFSLLEAVDYRGDVTLHLKGGETRVGYVYDVSEERVHYMESKDGSKASVERAKVQSVETTGRDHAEGKSWEAWVKKYYEKHQDRQPRELERLPMA